MKKLITILITTLYILSVFFVPAYAKIYDLPIEINSVEVTLKPVEFANYKRDGLESGKYDVYISATAKTGVTLAVGADRHYQLVSYNLSSENYMGKLYISDDTQNIRIENTGKVSFKYSKVTLKKIKKEAELEINNTSTDPKETFTVSGKVSSDNGYDNIKLKAEIFEDGEKKSEIFYDIEKEFEKIITPQGDKMVFSVWDKIENVAISEEKEIVIGTKTEIYVSKNAAFGGDGSKNAPFNSIDSAKKKVRELNDDMKGDIAVQLEGEFILEEKLSFTEEDSGTNGFKIVWDGGEKTVISGRKSLGVMTPEKNKPYVKVKTKEIPRQVYINGKHAKRARSENIKILSLYDDESYTGKNHNYDGIVVSGDVFKDGIENFEGMQVVFVHLWNRAFFNVSDIVKNDDGNYIIKFMQPEFDAFFTPKQIEEVFFTCHIENSPLFLDEQDEWCYSGETDEILYIPKRYTSMYDNFCEIAKCEGLIDINSDGDDKVRNLTFKGIEFTYGGWNEPQEFGFAVLQAEERYLARHEGDEFDYGSTHHDLIPAQISVKNGQNIIFEKNKFTHLASTAIAFSETTKESEVSDCVFDDISAAAVNVGDTDVAITAAVDELSSKIKVHNNYITKVGEDFPSSPAVTIYYANNVEVSNNHIENVPYSGISLGWGWGRNRENCRDIKILNNKIIGVMGVQNDGGHIYTLGAMPGSVISGNYLEKSADTRGGIYIDNSTQYVLITQNAFESVNTWIITESASTYNKKNNTAKNNYSRVKYRISDPDLNNYEEAKSMYIAENLGIAQEIIRKAGIKSK